MRESKRLIELRAYVEQKLAGQIICERCGATLETFADVCTADLSDACPGFMAIEKVRAEFWNHIGKESL